MEGFVVIHRSIIDTPIYQTPELFHLFVHCILRANYKERRLYIGGKVVNVKPGQFITGREKFAKEVGSKPSTVRNRLEVLQRLNYISIFSTERYSIISVNNYELYQNKENGGQPKDSRRTAGGQPEDTDNKETKITREEEEYETSSEVTFVSGKPPTRPRVSYVDFLDVYNRIAGKTFGGKKTLTDKLQKKVKLLVEYLDEIGMTPEEYFTKAINTDFLKRGSDKRPWKATFDFLVNVNKADKLISGDYDSFREKKEAPKRKVLTADKKNAIMRKYEAMLSEGNRQGAEDYRQSMKRLEGYDPKLDE